jgi:predicted transcriptional regulator of viral defense system
MNDLTIRSLSSQESRVVLSLAELKTREASRKTIIDILGVSPKAADHVIRSLRRKGWLERGSWGRYLLIPAEQGPEAAGESNVLALASLIADPYYIGYGTAAAHYGFTTQRRNIIWLVTPQRLRDRKLLNAEVHIVNVTSRKFFGFGPVDVLGHEVNLSDREKTAIDCVDRPDLCGGLVEAAYIFGRASSKVDWDRISGHLLLMNSIALTRKVGWLADHVGASVPDYVRADLLARTGKHSTKATFGRKTPRPNALGYQSEWKLTVNASVEELAESKGIARRHIVQKEP